MSREKTARQHVAAFNWRSTREVAALLGMTTEHVRGLIRDEHLGPSGVMNISRSSRAIYRISPEEIERFMRESKERFLAEHKERKGEPQTA